MRRAYLLIIIPAAIVGAFYFWIFRSMSMQIHPGPFLGTLGAFVVALLLVRHYSRRKTKRRGN